MSQAVRQPQYPPLHSVLFIRIFFCRVEVPSHAICDVQRFCSFAISLTETQLKLDDLGTLKRVLQPLSPYWISIADQLGMTSQVAVIRRSPDNTSPSAFLRDLLFRWLSREHPSPTLEALCQALRGDDEIVGGANVAKNLEEVFQGLRQV